MVSEDPVARIAVGAGLVDVEGDADRSASISALDPALLLFILLLLRVGIASVAEKAVEAILHVPPVLSLPGVFIALKEAEQGVETATGAAEAIVEEILFTEERVIGLIEDDTGEIEDRGGKRDIGAIRLGRGSRGCRIES